MEPYADLSVDVNPLKKSRCSEIIGICDEASIVTHNLIGQILDKWLLVENNEVDEPTRLHLGDGSQKPQGTLNHYRTFLFLSCIPVYTL